MVNGTLFFGMTDGNLYSRTFNGTTFGTRERWSTRTTTHDGVAPNWDTVQTGSGQTFAGIASNFYGELGQVTGMTYAGGKLYYSLFGEDGALLALVHPAERRGRRGRVHRAGRDRVRRLGWHVQREQQAVHGRAARPGT